MAEKIKINPKVVRKQIEEEGMTRVELAQHYNISGAQIKKFLEMTNMDKLRAKQGLQFEIESDDCEEETLPHTQVEVKEELSSQPYTPSFNNVFNNQ